MIKTSMNGSLVLAVCLLMASFSFSATTPQKVTHIFFNGAATRAYFNDGDTLKILDGELKNTRVRIAGFNTLETYGPVHEWMANDPQYLLSIAAEATRMAQDGQWHCTSKGDKDTYGRMLATCDDLAIALLSAGYAHSYSVNDHPADRKYLLTQHTAKTNKLGIWKHGAPNYIITSLHSADEGARKSYNRLISTTDGTTKTWQHTDTYSSCQKVCVSDEASCMVYVPFEERYGNDRPNCLR